MKKILTIITNGFEEIETVTPLDILHRAGTENTIVAVGAGTDLLLKGRSEISLKANVSLENLEETTSDFEKIAEKFDALFLPGGPGTWTLLKDRRVSDIAKAFAKKEKLIAAICAAPLILNSAGLLAGKRVSAHSCAWEEIPAARNSVPVEFDGNILTSRGAGTAFKFALAFTEKLFGKAVAEKIAADTMQ